MLAHQANHVRARKRLLVRDGQPVQVTSKAFDLLLALIERGGREMTASSDLDLYVVYAGVNLRDASVATRITWKRNSLAFWVQRAAQRNKDVWIAEMQASPWQGVDGFTPDDLVSSAAAYRGQGESTVLFWGVEQWLMSPTWMAAGQSAAAILRGS